MRVVALYPLYLYYKAPSSFLHCITTLQQWRPGRGLHRALYWGHLRAAALLLEAGAQLSVLDHQVRSLEASPGGIPGSCVARASGKTKKGVTLCLSCVQSVTVICARPWVLQPGRPSVSHQE